MIQKTLIAISDISVKNANKTSNYLENTLNKLIFSNNDKTPSIF